MRIRHVRFELNGVAMNEITLDDIKQFHVELSGIAAAGIPVQLGMGENAKTLVATLDGIAADFDIGQRKGNSLESAISTLARLSPTYRSALETWLRCNGSSIAFDSLTASPIGKRRLNRVYQLSLLQPIILIGLGYFALIYIFAITIPKFESLTEQLNHAPGFALSIMIWIRNAMVIWVPLVPLALIWGVIVWRKRAKSVSTDWTLLGNRYLANIRNASDSDRLAELVSHDVSIAKAMELSSLSNVPPLMRWASTRPTAESTSATLRLVAATYRQIAQIRDHTSRSWLPAIAVGFIGGLVVLGVGLSVFLPMVEFLLELSRPS